MPPTAPRAQRRTKLSFDVAREAVAEVQTGWVFRSAEAPAAEPLPAARPEAPAAAPEVLPAVPELAPGREAWTVAIRVPPGQVVTSKRPVERPARGWIESGLYVMTAPMAIGVGVMLAPVIWMLRSRLR